jgi:hypothetical protein
MSYDGKKTHYHSSIQFAIIGISTTKGAEYCDSHISATTCEPATVVALAIAEIGYSKSILKFSSTWI